ncbi:MAG: hypothetical protein AB1480_11815 [Nitrospirota bacterium]
MKEIKVFIGYASDAEAECDFIKKIIQEETDNHFSEDGYNFKPFCWKDVLPGLGHPQKEKIDPNIIDPNCRLVIILLKNIMGTVRRDKSSEIIENFNEEAKTFVKHVRGIIYDENTNHLIVTKDLLEERMNEIIPHFLQYVPKDKFIELQEVLTKMKAERKTKLGEAYALIMTIYYLRGICSEEILIEVLNDKQLIDEGKEESFKLLANQVRFEENVDKCLKIIINLLEQEDVLKGKVSILFMQARPEDLKKFVPIVKKVIEKPHLRGEALYYILEYLEKSILIDPLETFSLLENNLANAGDDFYNLRDFIPASHSRAPLNIINTIFECYPEQENRALEALDKLIELRWEGVDEYLYALDRL